MDDDRLISSTGRIAEPSEPPADFLDRLYESLADELGLHGEARPIRFTAGRRGRPRSQRMRVYSGLLPRSFSLWRSSAAWLSPHCLKTATLRW